MASDPVVRLTRAQEHSWAVAWLSFAWQGEADGAGGSQERRAYAEWLCHGAPPGLWSWIAEWLEREDAAIASALAWTDGLPDDEHNVPDDPDDPEDTGA